MTKLDHTIFNERPESQDRAIDQLRSMGYVYVSPAEAEVKRGHLSKVLFKDELRRFLSSQNFTYRNKITAFADSTIGKAIEDLDIPLQNGLLPASKTIYDTLLLGRSYEEQLFDGGKQSFDLNFIDWEHPEKNIWQVTEEFSVERDNGRYARPDIVILLNGIPVVVIECKRSGVDVTEGIKQNIRNWHPDYIPHLFKFAQLVIAMNPNDVRYGTCGTPAEFFTKWQEEESVWQENEVKKHIKGKTFTNQDRAIISLLSPERLLKLIRYYVFYDNGLKKISRYQQFFGVENIMRRITGEDKKDSRGGFIWHTQGSGKSLTMVMLTKRILAEKKHAQLPFRTGLRPGESDQAIAGQLHPHRSGSGPCHHRQRVDFAFAEEGKHHCHDHDQQVRDCRQNQGSDHRQQHHSSGGRKPSLAYQGSAQLYGCYPSQCHQARFYWNAAPEKCGCDLQEIRSYHR